MHQFAGEGYHWSHLSIMVHPPREEDNDGQHPCAPAAKTRQWFAKRLSSSSSPAIRLSKVEQVYSKQEKSNLYTLFILFRAVKRSFL